MVSFKMFVVLLVFYSTSTISNCQPIGKSFTNLLTLMSDLKVEALFKPICFISTDNGMTEELKETIQNLTEKVDKTKEKFQDFLVKVEKIEERLINHSKYLFKSFLIDFVPLAVYSMQK